MKTHQNKYFLLDINQNEDTSQLRMELFGSIVSTKKLPHTFAFLQATLPTVLNSKCFNEKNYPFSKEVRDTEIGHLFEHILLEYLCILEISNGASTSIFNGLTKWNWSKDKKGVFHIQVDAGLRNADTFTKALQKSVELTTRLLEEQINHAQNSVLLNSN